MTNGSFRLIIYISHGTSLLQIHEIYFLFSVFPMVTMTVDKIKRSQSMWAMSPVQKNNAVSNFTTNRSYSVVSASSFNLSEGSKNKVKFGRRFRKRNDKKNSSQATRYVCPPCLCGDVDAVDSQGRSLLFYAARYGQIETANQLVEAGCSPNQKDSFGNTPLHEAIEKRHLEVAEIFLQNGESPAPKIVYLPYWSKYITYIYQN